MNSLKLKSILMLSSVALFATASTALAQIAPTDVTSRNNRNLESEGTARMHFRWVRDGGVYARGNASVNHQLRFFDGSSENGVQVSLETRMFELCADDGIVAAGERCGRRGTYSSPGLRNSTTGSYSSRRDEEAHFSFLMFPLETTLRFNIDNPNRVDVQKIRQGIVRFMLAETGVNIQFLSYLQQQFQGSRVSSEDLVIRGLEILNVQVNESPDFDADGNYELILRISGGLAMGRATNDETRRLRAMVEADPTLNSANINWLFQGSAAIGLRFHRRVVIEAFAGIERIHDSGGSNGLRDDLTPITIVQGTNFYYGGQLRAILVQNRFDLTVRAERSHLSGSSAVPENDQTTVTTGFQVHW